MLNYKTLDDIPDIPMSLLQQGVPLIFQSNVGTKTQFEGSGFREVAQYDITSFDGIEGSKYAISIFGDSEPPKFLEVTDGFGNSLVVPDDVQPSLNGSLISEFIAPYTGSFYIISVLEDNDKVGSLIALADEDVQKAEILKTENLTPITIPKIVSNQKIVGTSKSDNLIGNDGIDTLTGGLGFDTLTGGKGADKFIFSSIKDAPLSHSKIEVITDFSSSEKDKIDLSKIDADTSKAKDQAFSAPVIGSEFSGEFTKAGQLFFDTTDHILYGTVNNGGTASFAIQLNGVSSLASSDFVL
jgi:hypothetical protein